MVPAEGSRSGRGDKVAPGIDPRLRILAVEDDPAFAGLLQAAFAFGAEAGKLWRSGSLGGALRLLREREFDAVLLDLNLSDSEGIDTLRRVLDAAPHVAVVVLTGVAASGVAREALRLGAQDWLVKGALDPDVIQRAVRYAVERKRLTDGLLKAQKLEVAGRLATGVAHEFNNVLTAILGTAQLIDAAPDAAARQEAVELLRRAARQGAALSRQLLSLARNPPSNATLVSSRLLVESALPLVQAILPASIELAVDALADVDVEIDPGQFDQMLLNLVFNARDAMSEGGTLRLRVDHAPPPAELPRLGKPSYAVFRVIDTGRGIEPAVLQHLFEPFFSTKGWKGTGLGLAVSSEIVERFGGAIHVDSQIGAGTTISVWLPAASMPSEAEKEARA
jgi:signal transduction histidine kinase